MHHGVRVRVFFRRRPTIETAAAPLGVITPSHETHLFIVLVFRRRVGIKNKTLSRTSSSAPPAKAASAAAAVVAAAAAVAAAEAAVAAAAAATAAAAAAAAAEPRPPPQQKQQKKPKARTNTYVYSSTYT